MLSFKTSLFILIAILICSGVALAELNTAVILPDLSVKSVDFVPVPKEGGAIDLVKICVVNQGKADAAKCSLGLSCTVIKCSAGSECEKMSRMISGDIAVPTLKAGEESILEWRPDSPLQWPGGKYSVAADLDKYNAVQEANEANNINQSTIYIASFSPRASD